MTPRGRNVFGAAGGLGTGVAVALACASSSAAGPSGAPLGPSGGSDAGAMSALVAHAQRGEVIPPRVEDVEQMCALLTGCDKLPIPPTLIGADFAACVKKVSDEMTAPVAINFSLTMRECGLHSSSCANLRACALRGAPQDACVGRGKQGVVGFCDVDGRALTCWHEQVLAVRDCPRGGEQCIVVGGDATCTLGPCPGNIKEGERPVCSASGTHLLHCEKGKLASLDCAAFGLKCSAGSDGVAACATGGGRCDPAAKRCEGNVAVGCVSGHEVRVDCAAAGLTCNAAGGTPVGSCLAPAVPPTDSCDPSDKPKCDEGNIKYCYAGRLRSYSCKGAGFGRCDGTRGPPRCAP
jgi:hypothetical protein